LNPLGGVFYLGCGKLTVDKPLTSYLERVKLNVRRIYFKKQTKKLELVNLTNKF